MNLSMPTFFQLSIPRWKTFTDPGECHLSDLGEYVQPQGGLIFSIWGKTV